MSAKPLHSDYRKEGYESLLVLPDTHFDQRNGEIVGIDHPAFNAVMMFAASQRWERWVQLGDFGDWDCVSSHNKGNLRAVEGQRIKQSAAACNVGLDTIQANVRKHGEPIEEVLISGNHDYRLVAWANAQPVLEGMIEFEDLLHLNERGITYVDYWGKGEVWTCGKVSFIHGLYTGSTAASRHAVDHGCNIVAGHTHGFGMTPVKTHGNEIRISLILGCLCDLSPVWMRGKPAAWTHAFGVFYIRKEDGRFTFYTPLLFDGQFVSPDGRYFDGRSPRGCVVLPKKLPSGARRSV